jgi:hypothetical protein
MSDEWLALHQQPLPDVAVLTDVLDRLCRPVTISPAAPEAATRVHLARVLVAVAELCALRAEHALTGQDRAAGKDADVDDHQGTYDQATARNTLQRLALNYWRSQRLTAGVQALREAMHQHDPDLDAEDPPSALAEIWQLTTPVTAACEGLLGILARVTLTDDAAEIVTQLDIVTALLASAGEHATQLRAEIGLDPATLPV